MRNNMTIRIVILTLCFLATTAYLASASHTEPVSVRLPLSGFPMQLEKWHGQDAGDFNARVVTMLGVDDYINRAYMKQSETASLYIGFYQSQRQGSAIHSPMNCLPGAGWNPVERSAL